MKILLVSDKLVYDGRTSYALGLAKGVKDTGAALQFCLTGGELRARLDALKIESYLVKHNLFSFLKLINFLNEFGPDVIHVTSERALGPGRRLARGLKRKYLVTVHDLLDVERLPLHHTELQGVIVGNEALRELLVNRLNVPKERIRLINKGVDLDAFDVPAPSIQDRLPVIGCIGRFIRGKGHKTFLRAARSVLDSAREALFLLVGQGDEERQLRKCIRELDLNDAVTVSPPMDRARDIYRAMDIVVLPAFRASSSLTAIEAMAARRPVIASVVGDMLHLVKNEENGLAVEPDNVPDLADAMCRLLDDPGYAGELGERARDLVVRKYSLSRMVESTVGLYDEVIRGEFPRR